jgi:hypothetical protein
MRPSRRFSPALLAFALQVFLAPAARGNPVTMAVSPSGELTLRLDGRTVATGAWRLRPDSYLPAPGPAPFDPGSVVSASGTQDAPAHATVHEEHVGVTADYLYDLAGEDLRIAAHVVNTDRARSLKPVAFSGVVFHFNPAAPITGSMPVWHWTYLQACGIDLFHPSVRNPIGCWWAADDHFGFCLDSDSEFDRADMVAADWGGHDYVIPAEARPNFYTDRGLAPGSSADVALTLRVTADRSLPHLIGAYKATFDRRFPLPMDTPDPRPVGQFTTVDAQHVTRGNPLGYHAQWARFDSALSTARYVSRAVPQLLRAGGAGTIFWSPGGYREPMYPPDFDDFPPAVLANLPALVDGFHARGLRAGLCARCGEGVRRPPGAPPVVYRLSADDPGQMREVLDRFRHALRMGFDMFYLDSIGGYGLNDVRVIRKVRATVGPDVPLYTEYCTDMSLPYADRYCEWTADNNIRWNGGDSYATLRLLCPRATWLCTSETRELVPAPFARLGLVPIVSDQALGRLPRAPTTDLP